MPIAVSLKYNNVQSKAPTFFLLDICYKGISMPRYNKSTDVSSSKYQRGGSLDSHLKSGGDSRQASRGWKQSSLPMQFKDGQHAVSEDFTDADIKKFDECFFGMVNILENSSQVTSRTNSSSKKSRGSEKRVVWENYEEIKGKLPSIFKCLNDHAKHGDNENTGSQKAAEHSAEDRLVKHASLHQKK